MLDLQEHVNRLIQSAEIAAHSIDKNGVLIAVSAGWLSLLGYEESEVLGKKSTDFLDALSKDLAAKVLPEYYEKGKCHNVPYTFLAKNGSSVPVLLSADSVWDSGRFLRSIAILEPLDCVELAQRVSQIDQWKKSQRTDIRAILEASKTDINLNSVVVLTCSNEYWFKILSSAAQSVRGVQSVIVRVQGMKMETVVDLD